MLAQHPMPLHERFPWLTTTAAIGALILIACSGDASDPEDVSSTSDELATSSVPGVHTPMSIDPDVDVPNSEWLRDLYAIVLGRPRDVSGYKTQFAALQFGVSRQIIFNSFIASAEFQGSAALKSKRNFISRLYTVLLHRTPSASEIDSWAAQTKALDGSGAGATWFDRISSFYGAAEYKAKNCDASYYTLGAKVNANKLLLRDLFSGKARLQTVEESEAVSLHLPSATAIFDQKLPIIADPHGGYLGFTRGYVGGNKFNIFMVTSPDGVHFTQTGDALFTRANTQTFYDAHIAIDHGVCPTRYVMSMECIGAEGAASLCTSESTTPWMAETWTIPRVIVNGCDNNPAGACNSGANASASTGVAFIDGKHRYLSWTQVYDGLYGPDRPDDGNEHTYSLGTNVTSFDQYWGTAVASTRILLSSEPHPHCNDVWDCNNRDKQDWKREGSAYYVLYNGSSYFRCDGEWGISVGRSTVALSETPWHETYSDRLPLEHGIRAVRADTCGISYPMLNVIDGEPFVYYAYYPKTGGNRTMRARIVPITP